MTKTVSVSSVEWCEGNINAQVTLLALVVISFCSLAREDTTASSVSTVV